MAVRKRALLESLPRSVLLAFAAAQDLRGLTGKPKERIVEAIMERRSLRAEDLLATLSRDQLKELCRAHGLDETGREKQRLIDRLLGAGEADGKAASAPNGHGSTQKNGSRGRAKTAAATPEPAMKNLPATDYRHPAAKRKNNPPAKIAAEGAVPVLPKAQYAYNPHLPPILRFDQTGAADVLETRLSAAAEARSRELLAEAGQRPLTDEERAELGGLLKAAAHARVAAEPWLEWTGKREKKWFEVDPVALHIHERVSAQAILKVAARQDVTRDLFADPEQEYHDAVQFYKHDVDWSNRLILGDSLQVMSSLARREDLAGKVQMIYMDPPYGINYRSNFQPEVGQRDVNDKERDLTREPEMVRAYRDTWHLGIHSYLSYLRDRLVVARELLSDTGSLFVQISDENVHRVRDVLDEVFGAANFMLTILLKKKGGQKSGTMDPINDYILWTTKDRKLAATKFRRLFVPGKIDSDYLSDFSLCEFPCGNVLSVSQLSRANQTSYANEPDRLVREHPDARLLTSENITIGGVRKNQSVLFEAFGRIFDPGIDRANCWKHRAQRVTPETLSGMERLLHANRLWLGDEQIRVRRYADDFGASAVTNWWDEFGGAKDRVYVVQTNHRVVERCLLMTTDPGDLVLDPTCGSGTTAYVAEQWGRRWITIDTSRVAIALARQRLLTAEYEAYKLRPLTARDTSRNPSGHWLRAAGEDGKGEPLTIACKTVPHISSSVVANCAALDPIFAKHEPILDGAIQACNAALKKVPADLKAKLAAKLAAKQKNEGKRAITDADRRRWLLPPENREQPRTAEEKKRYTVDLTVPTWYHWEVPFDTDPDWPKELQQAVLAYRNAWRAKMDEVNACIEASAEQEELVDQPLKAEKVNGREVVRVSGPFTVEAVQPPEMALGDVVEIGDEATERRSDGGEFDGAPDELDSFEVRMVEPKRELEVENVGAYLDQMFRYLKADGVRFLGNKQMKWSRLEPLFESGSATPFHAEGRWTPVGDEDADPDGRATVAVAFGPQYGPVTAAMVVNLVREAHIRGYDHVVIAGFNFDGAAQTAIEKQSSLKVKIHMAHIRPDINPGMNGLLKEPVQAGSGQLFTVFGQPRIRVDRAKGEDGRPMFTVTMEGVDVYNPVDDSITSTGAAKVAAWFVDSDYDGVTFCITQAFFPDRTAWEKLARALNGKDGPIDADRFAAFSGTTSLPFPPGEHKRVAVKVIDPRGNEVMAVESL